MEWLIYTGIGFGACLFGFPIFMGILKALGIYTIVPERQCQVFVLFGKVIGVIPEPGLHFLLPRFGWKALIMRWMGKKYEVDLRLDQRYLRSLGVNSEEGAPMGIGVWYEMFLSDPIAYLFKNNDPDGSLAANVANSAVRSLSNMPLDEMLVDRHTMSQAVRSEVSPKSHEWGYQLGSVYIRKVHFRDPGMIREIEAKVVNRLRQVTSAIKQDGANRVSVIKSAAERKSSVEFARAAAMRPDIVGQALKEISEDPIVAQSLFDALEADAILEGSAKITWLPKGAHEMATFIAASEASHTSQSPTSKNH